MIKACLYCKKEFISNRKDKKYCSRKCKNNDYYLKNRTEILSRNHNKIYDVRENIDEYDFEHAYQLYINKDAEIKITKLYKRNYSSFYMLLEKNSEYHFYFRGIETDIEEDIYRYNDNMYFSMSKSKIKDFAKNIEKYKKIINRTY